MKLAVLFATIAVAVIAAAAHVPTAAAGTQTPTAGYYPPIRSYYGQLNRAGFPKTQYVRPYVRSNGTVVSGYWRNSPSDGLRTCLIVRC